MGKDTHLINIYLKIHHKKPLTMDDLRYLAEYAPECFEKTCKNVVYNIPETKPIMESHPVTESAAAREFSTASSSASMTARKGMSGQQKIEKILENLKRLEINDFPMADIDVDKVKSLLGNLYMELLFPHNDKDTFMSVVNNRNISTFDRKV